MHMVRWVWLWLRESRTYGACFIFVIAVCVIDSFQTPHTELIGLVMGP